MTIGDSLLLPPKKPILVMGVGNVLMTDEGIGVHVVSALSQLSLPSEVEILDGGTLGFDLIHHMEERLRLILIDAVQTEEPGGTIFKFSPHEISEYARQAKLSFHQLGFMDMLKVAGMIDLQLPQITIFGIQPYDIGMGTSLSPKMSERVPQIIKLVLEEVEMFDTKKMNSK